MNNDPTQMNPVSPSAPSPIQQPVQNTSVQSPTQNQTGGTLNVRNFISQAQSKGVSSDDIYSYLSQKGYVSGGKITDTPTSQNTTTPSNGFDTSVQNTIAGTSQIQQQQAGAIGNDIQNAAQDINAGNDAFGKGDIGGGLANTGKALVQGGLGTASNALQYFLAPLTATIGTISQNTANVAGNNKTLQGIATSPVADKITAAMQAVQAHIAQHPVLAKALVDAYTVGTAGVAGEEAPDALESLGNAVSDTADSVKGTINDTASAVKGKVGDVASSIKEKVSPSLSPEEQVGKIIQGKTSDIPAAQRTFDALPSDTPPVAKMSPSDLSSSIDTNVIQKNLGEVDTKFANDTTPHQMSDFEQTTGKGASAVKSNYVQQAIDQLKDFYTKTNDAQGLSDIKSMEEKANTEGLTSKELNDLSKEHGLTIKAFNANGEAASGLTKQAAENTRAGVKTTARNILSQSDPEGAAEVTRLDRETSDAIKTKNLLDKQVEKENVKVQKNGKESKLSKAYNSKTGKVVRKLGEGAGVYEAGKKLITGSF